MTSIQVAEVIHIHPQTYRHKEYGKAEFTITEARKLADLFGCTLDDLFNKERVM